MRTALVALNLLLAAASAGLFGYTFFARDHLVGLAREYVVRKTVAYTTPYVDKAEAAWEAALKNPLLGPRLGLRLNDQTEFTLFRSDPAVREAVRAEFAAYRRDPAGYVRELVDRPAAEKPRLRLPVEAAGWKADARAYFETVLAGLIRDVRIFAGTNVVAGLLAAWLAYKARGRWRYHVLGLSGLLLFAVALQAYLFVDGLTFFRIVLDWRVGWSYPVLVFLSFGYLYARIGRHVPLAADEPDRSGSGAPAAVR